MGIATFLAVLAAWVPRAAAEPQPGEVPAIAQAVPVDGDGSGNPEARAIQDSAAAVSVAGPRPGASHARRRTPRAAARIQSGPAGASSGARRGSPALPRDLSDANAWLDYKSRAHLLALPAEARLFYRRGLMEHDAGKREEGERWVRAAAELDPSFVEPHLTIAAWSLPGRPSQAMVHWATVLEMARESYPLQAGLVANALYLGFQSLLLALLAAGVILVGLRTPELSHPWRERLGTILRPATARWWALAFVVLPYLSGLGAVLPTIVFLGLLWPALRVRERALFVLLTLGVAAVPWVGSGLERLVTPLDPGRAPFRGTALLENESWSAERQSRLAALAAREPENPFLHFAHAWIARRGGDLATAEREYRRVLERWPGDDRVLANLGNVLAMQGRQDEALQLYQRASAARPGSAAPHFNESQIYTQRFEYVAATEALSRASALDFDLVRDYQSLGTNDGVLALVDQWIVPRNFWLALREAPGGVPAASSLPPFWRGRLETSGWRFGVAALVCALLAAVAGAVGNRVLPLRSCNNCGRVVCRRCAQRRREVALCRNCAALETRAENADFARVLLRRNRRETERMRHGVRTAIAVLVPGFGLLAHRRAVTPVLLLAGCALLAAPWTGVPLPFELEPRLGAQEAIPLPLRLGLAAVIYAVSIGGYFTCVARARLHAAAVAAAEAAESSARPASRTPARAA